jgi:uncharacterized OsmC-like protein
MDAMANEGMTRNGIDLERVAGLIGRIEADPALARFRFRARNRWVGGSENRSTLFDFDGLGETAITRHKPFEYTNDEPPALIGHDESANALEFLLHALAGSITTTFVLRAAALGVVIDSLFTEVEGEIDVRGMLGVAGAPASGYERIRVVIDVTATASESVLEEIIEFARVHAPVCGALMHAVPVRIERAPDR